MRIVIHATEIIDGKTYITENYTVEAKECLTPDGAESVMGEVCKLGNDTFDRIRERQHWKAESFRDEEENRIRPNTKC